MQIDPGQFRQPSHQCDHPGGAAQVRHRVADADVLAGLFRGQITDVAEAAYERVLGARERRRTRKRTGQDAGADARVEIEKPGEDECQRDTRQRDEQRHRDVAYAVGPESAEKAGTGLQTHREYEQRETEGSDHFVD